MEERDYNESLAISMQAAPGFYALLLGSGLSRSARIPTGWEIVILMLRKLAAVRRVKPVPLLDEDVLEWYKTSAEAISHPHPSYDWLISGTYQEREQRDLALIHYFEATEQERLDEGEDYKSPTIAHKAIARLMKHGYIRLVLTTNFDRLLENALLAEGVEHTTVTYDQVATLMPLHCYDHLIIKLHGDYKTFNLLNTQEELSCYSAEVNQLLSEVFRDYKFIISGWSAQYDHALVECITTAKRRWNPIWVDIRDLGETSRDLAQQLNAEVHVITSGADAFFPDLEEGVMAVEDIQPPTPLSIEIAIARLKRLLSGSSSDPIEAYELLTRETRKVMKQINEVSFNIISQKRCRRQLDDFEEYFDAINIITDSIIALTATTTMWYKQDIQKGLA